MCPDGGLFHFKANSHIDSLLLIRHGWLVVDFFFVLSGFVIAANYSTRLSPNTGTTTVRQFMKRRFLRLYPLHVFMLLLFVVTEGLILLASMFINLGDRPPFTGARDPALIPENLFLLQSLGISGIESWNVPSWSISAEVWAYLVFALAMAGGALGRWAFWCIAFVGAPLAILFWFNGNIALEADGGILRCLMGFGMGATLWIVLQPAKRPLRAASAVEAGVLAIALCFVVLSPTYQVTLIAPLIFAAVIWVFSAEHGLFSRWLSWRPFLFLGTISYSLYMTHTYVHARLKNIYFLAEEYFEVTLFADDNGQMFGTTLFVGDLFILQACALTIGVSYLTWRLIEVPGQKLGQKRIQNQP